MLPPTHRRQLDIWKTKSLSFEQVTVLSYQRRFDKISFRSVLHVCAATSQHGSRIEIHTRPYISILLSLWINQMENHLSGLISKMLHQRLALVLGRLILQLYTYLLKCIVVTITYHIQWNLDLVLLISQLYIWSKYTTCFIIYSVI